MPLELFAPHTGLHVIGWLPSGVDDRIAAIFAAKHGVDVLPLSMFAIEAISSGAFVLGYGALNQQQIEAGVRRLSEALRSAV